MLLATGTVLEFTSEQVNPPNGQPFESVSVRMLTGKSDVIELRMGRDVRATDYPREGDVVTFEVAVSAFGYKSGGAGVRYTGVKRVHETPDSKSGGKPALATA